MSDENNTQPSGGEALPAEKPEVTAKPAPKNDIEAAAQEQEAEEAEAAAQTPDPKAEAEKAERHKNRTREYINRKNRENAELRQKLAELEARQQPSPSQAQPAPTGEPTLEDFEFDQTKFQRAHTAWGVEQALKQRDEQNKQAEATKKQRDIADAYDQRIAEFTDDHPDFQEVVGSIAYPLPPETQLAIMAHEQGAELAYHLGNNDDDAFALASIQPHLAAAAVQRLASRLTAAPTPAPSTPQAQVPEAKPKPVSQAPAPAPTISGRSPTETPPEKLTDDEWAKRERERERKR